MPPLPVLSGNETRRAFEKLGWRFDRQMGSHMILVKETSAVLTVPRHKVLAPGTLRGLIRQSGLTVEEFLAAVK
ncbi:MAG: type II toxin-antitoxin system HicA family toxin [Fimbriimonadaceae bacterium]